MTENQLCGKGRLSKYRMEKDSEDSKLLSKEFHLFIFFTLLDERNGF